MNASFDLTECFGPGFHPLCLPSPPPVPVEIFVSQPGPTWGTGVAIGIAILALVASTVAAFIAYAKLQADTLLALVRESTADKFDEAIRIVILLPPFTDAADFQRTQNAIEDENTRRTTAAAILLVSEFFDRLGALVRRHHVSFGLILPTYGSRIVESWAHLKPILSSSEFYKRAHSKNANRVAKALFPNNFEYLAEKTGKLIPKYSDMQVKELAARFKRISEGTATPDDWIF